MHYAANTLITINPFDRSTIMEMYGAEKVAHFLGNAAAGLHPHIYSIGENLFFDSMIQFQYFTILIRFNFRQ